MIAMEMSGMLVVVAMLLKLFGVSRVVRNAFEDEI